MPDTSAVKLNLKTAQIEIEYEGSEEFLRSDLLGFITKVAESHITALPLGATSMKLVVPPPGSQQINLSVNSIAAKLKVNSGPGLVLAACAYHTLAQGRDTFSRKDILDAMKSGSTYYKKTYSNNLSAYIDGLVKDGKLLQQANDAYALAETARTELETRIAS